MAGIDMLGVDELLIIFSLLTIRDKIMSMRVCKNWHSIICRPQVWSVINFFDQPELDTSNLEASFFRRFVSKGEDAFLEYRGINEALLQYNQKWLLQFPPNSSQVLNFLTSYCGSGLKEVYLTANSIKIMDTLCKFCPNLKTLCYITRLTGFSKNSFAIDGEDILETLSVPRNLRTLFLERPNFISPHVSREFLTPKYDSSLLSLISEQCTTLEELSLLKFRLSEIGLMKIAEPTTLKKLELLFCSTSNRELADLDQILSKSVGHLKQIQTFTLQIPEYHRPVLSSFFEQVSHWEHLKVLSLRGCSYDNDVFAMLLPGLHNLQRLHLSGPCITSVVITLIGTHLKALTLLELENGSYSSERFDSLASHPSLKTVLIDITNQTDMPADFLYDVYKLIRTLPQINFVRLRGKMLSETFNCEKFPLVKETVDIEVQDIEYRSFSARLEYDKIRIIHEAQGKMNL